MTYQNRSLQNLLAVFCHYPARCAASHRSILAAMIAPASALLVWAAAPSAWADAIFAPGDPIIGGQINFGTNQFVKGVVGTAAGINNWPGGESPDHAIDGVGQKYLNFGETNTGFLVNPTFNGGNGSVVTSIKLWTANDAIPRDPQSYQLFGTNAALNFALTNFAMSNFTLISSGGLALPDSLPPRQMGGGSPLLDVNSQTLTFNNTQTFKEYLVIFPTVKNSVSANSMQIGEVQLFGTTPPIGTRIWTGSVSDVWDVNTTANWSDEGGGATFLDTAAAIFNDTALPARTNISIQNGGVAVNPASVTFQNNTLNYTISGDPIESTGALTKNGTASVTLNNLNSYDIGTIVNAGTLNVGASGTLGSADGALTVNNLNIGAGTAVAVNFNSAQTIGSLSGALAAPASGTNSATINLNGGLTVNQDTNTSFAGVLRGTGGLTKDGSGLLAVLANDNTYTGTTTVNGGTLESAAPSDTGQAALPAGQPVVVNSGGTLRLGEENGLGFGAGSVSNVTVNGGTVIASTGTHSILPTLTLNAGTVTATGTGDLSNYTLDGNVTTLPSSAPSTISAPKILLRGDPLDTGTSTPVVFTVPRGTAATDLIVSSAIVDNDAGLVKNGNGIMSLSGVSAYTGPTVINAGTIVASHPSSLGSGSVTLNNGGVLSLAAPFSLSGFANFSLNGGATVDGSTLTLTTNINDQTRSAFSQSQLPIASGFTASFVYTAGGNRAADGITFTVQNDPAGPAALGAGGGSLGYVGIANSAAYQINIYTGQNPPQPTGTNVAAGTAGAYISTAPVNVASGNPITVDLAYDSSALTLTETLTDQVTSDTYTNTFSVPDLTGIVGGTSAYIGFTGATGGAIATQTVDDFSFNNFSQGLTLPNNISVSAGATARLDVAAPSAGGAGSAMLEGAVTLNANSLLNVTGGATPTDAPYSLIVSGSTTLTGNSTINVADNGTGLGTVQLEDVNQSGGSFALTKMGPGTLTFNGPADNITINANEGEVEFNLDQTLAALNIGPAGSVTLTEETPVVPIEGLAGTGALHAVPEPGSVSLLAMGTLALLGRRRRTS